MYKKILILIYLIVIVPTITSDILCYLDGIPSIFNHNKLIDLMFFVGSIDSLIVGIIFWIALLVFLSGIAMLFSENDKVRAIRYRIILHSSLIIIISLAAFVIHGAMCSEAFFTG